MQVKINIVDVWKAIGREKLRELLEDMDGISLATPEPGIPVDEEGRPIEPEKGGQENDSN